MILRALVRRSTQDGKEKCYACQGVYLRKTTGSRNQRTPEKYLPNLLQIVRLFRESVALKPARASFRQGWKEALVGKTRAVADLWQRPPHGRWRVSRIDHLSWLR